MNDLACRSIHSSFYVEDPSISGPTTRPRTFVKGGESNGSYVVLASGKDTIGGGTTNSPATVADITHGIKIIHEMDTNPPTANINLHNNDKNSGKVGMKFDLTTGNISAGDRFCIVNSDGSVGVGGMTSSEMTAVGQSGLNRMLHVSGNVMVGTHPAANPSKTASSAMVLFNQATTAPTTTTYPGMYHRGVQGATATALNLTDTSGGLSITAPNFITFQTGTTSPQSNSIVINSAGDFSVIGRANLNGAVSIGNNFADTSTHGSVKSNLDINGTTHMSSTVTSYTDNPRIKLISRAIDSAALIPSLSQSTNEIRGVNALENSGFLRLTAQTPAKSCIDLTGDNTSSTNNRYSNSIRFNTANGERMIIDGSGNVGIGLTTTNPTVRLDVAGAAKITGNLDMSSSGKIVNLVNPTIAQDAATKSYVDTSIPIGGIIMWSGVGVTLPSNWKLCDGTTYNGVTTPDLRGRFILSSGQGSGLTNRTTGGTGGAETVSLNQEHMPSHSHGVAGTYTTNNNEGGHTHSVSASGTPQLPVYASQMLIYNGQQIFLVSNVQGDSGINRASYGTVSVSGTAANTLEAHHKHTVTISESTRGSNQAHENMPPFYVLAFIMRVS